MNSAIKNEFIKELLNMAYPHKTFPKDKTQNVKYVTARETLESYS